MQSSSEPVIVAVNPVEARLEFQRELEQLQRRREAVARELESIDFEIAGAARLVSHYEQLEKQARAWAAQQQETAAAAAAEPIVEATPDPVDELEDRSRVQ